MFGKATDAILRAGALGTLVNASTYGRTIPLIYGTTRSPVLAIWAANLRQSSASGKKSWLKGGPTYTENIDFLIGHNPLMFPLQVWDNANNFYSLLVKKYSHSVANTITIPDDPTEEFYAVLAVTITLDYDVTFDDYGSQGPFRLAGTFDQPLWNAAFNGPNPCDTAAYTTWFPYVYRWLPGTSTITLPFLPNALISGTVNIYYAAANPNVAKLARQNGLTGSEIPLSVLNLEWETLLGQGDEYSLAGASGQQIIYPWFAGVMSPNIDLGASGAIPNINIEMAGSFPLYPDATLDTMGGDADFADMITDIFTSGPAQGGYVSATQSSGALGLTAVQHGLNCCDFPGIVQRRVNQIDDLPGSTFTDEPFEAQVTEGDWLLVFYRNDTAAGHPSGISDTMGNTWTEILAESPGSSSNNVYGWQCQAKAMGPTAVTIAGGGYYHQQIEMFEIAGYDTLESVVTNTGDSSSPTVTISSTTMRTRPGLLFSWWSSDSASPPAPRWIPVTGQSVNEGVPSFGPFSEQRKVWGPATVTDTHAFFAGPWAVCALAFKNTNVPQYPVSLGNILEPTTMANARLGARAGSLYGSINMNSSKKAGDILGDLYASMNAAPVWSGFQLKSIAWSEVSAVGNGAIFTAPTASGPIASLGPSDFIGDSSTPPGSVDRKAEVDAPPILSMQIFDRANNYNQNLVTMPDPAGVALFGVRKASPMKRDEVQDPAVAEMLLGIASRRQVYIRNSYKYKVNMNWVLLEPMDLVLLSDPQIGLNNLPVRVTSVQEDKDHNLDMTFEPFIYGVHAPQPLTITANAPNLPEYGADPGSVNAPVFIEAVPQLALAENTEQLLIAVSGGGATYGGCQAYISTDGGSSYDPIGSPLHGSAITGYTVGDWPAHADPDQANDLTVDLSESNGELNSYSPEQRDSFDPLFYVAGGNSDIPYEIGSYNDAELTGTEQYTIIATGTGNEIRRAVYGAPAIHGAGVDHPNASRFAFLGNPAQGFTPGILQIPVKPAWVGVTLYFKFQAFNTFGAAAQSLADCTAYTFTPTGLPGSVNPAGQSPAGGVTPISSSSVTINQPDYGKLVTLSGSSAIAVTLDSTVTDNFFATIQNNSTAEATLTPSSGQIDGTTDLIVVPGEGVTVYFDGTNWWTFAGSSSGASHAYGIEPSGYVNGVNVDYALPYAPDPAESLILVQRTPQGGIVLIQGLDYTLTGTALTLTNPPVAGDALYAWFTY